MEQPNEMRRTWAQRVVAGGPDRRLLLALLSASVAAWATLWLALLVIYGIDRVERGGPVLDVEELKSSFFVAVFWPVVAAPTFVLGTLIHQSLSSFRFRRWPTYALTGCVVGFLISAASLALTSNFSYEYERQLGPEYHRGKFIEALPLALIFGGLPGVGAAIAFWVVLRPDRP